MDFERLEDYKPLFSTGLEIQEHLDAGQGVPEALRHTFKTCGISLSGNPPVSVETRGTRWLIADKENNRGYAVRKKQDRLAVYQNLHVVNQIVERDLCVRCGACEPACPVDIIRFDQNAFPYITDEQLCISTCTRCLKVCPGEFANFSKWDEEMFGISPHPESITGIVKRACVSFATDQEIRKEGTSGGFVTQILRYMLEKKIIDGALVLGASSESGRWEEQPFIARTLEDLKRAVKSKYVVTPFLWPLGEMERVEANYAVVGLPCYIHAVRRYQKVSKKIRERIKLIIGLYCNVAFEPHLFDDVCELKGLRKEDVVNFHFRYGDWPGGVIAELRDGRKEKVLKLEEMKDEFNMLKLFYTAPRCNMCIDFSAEYADLAVGDPWLRGPDGSYLFDDGRTSVLVRTDTGREILEKAVADGYVTVRDIPLSTYMVNFEYNARYKRDFVPKTILLRQLLNRPIPKYNRVIGHGTLSGILPMVGRTIILRLARFKWFRKFALTLAQTRPVIAYLAWNRKRKARQFAAKYLMRMKQIDRFLLSILFIGCYVPESGQFMELVFGASPGLPAAIGFGTWEPTESSFLHSHS